jgi:transposase
MGIRPCKLRRKEQISLIEFFVVEVTARSAGDILGFQANTVALFYRKVRQVIIENLPDIAPQQGEFEADES